jgi:hypothetical protein
MKKVAELTIRGQVSYSFTHYNQKFNSRDSSFYTRRVLRRKSL